MIPQTVAQEGLARANQKPSDLENRLLKESKKSDAEKAEDQAALERKRKEYHDHIEKMKEKEARREARKHRAPFMQ